MNDAPHLVALSSASQRRRIVFNSREKIFRGTGRAKYRVPGMPCSTYMSRDQHMVSKMRHRIIAANLQQSQHRLIPRIPPTSRGFPTTKAVTTTRSPRHCSSSARGEYLAIFFVLASSKAIQRFSNGTMMTQMTTLLEGSCLITRLGHSASNSPPTSSTR